MVTFYILMWFIVGAIGATTTYVEMMNSEPDRWVAALAGFTLTYIAMFFIWWYIVYLYVTEVVIPYIKTRRS